MRRNKRWRDNAHQRMKLKDQPTTNGIPRSSGGLFPYDTKRCSQIPAVMYAYMLELLSHQLIDQTQ